QRSRCDGGRGPALCRLPSRRLPGLEGGRSEDPLSTAASAPLAPARSVDVSSLPLRAYCSLERSTSLCRQESVCGLDRERRVSHPVASQARPAANALGRSLVRLASITRSCINSQCSLLCSADRARGLNLARSRPAVTRHPTAAPPIATCR